MGPVAGGPNAVLFGPRGPTSMLLHRDMSSTLAVGPFSFTVFITCESGIEKEDDESEMAFLNIHVFAYSSLVGTVTLPQGK